MAIRIHVAGVRNVPVSELKTELSDLGDFDMHESGGWVWFMTSVWQHSGTALLEELEKLPRAVLLATTEDGERWYLRLRGPKQAPYNLCHEFAMLGHPVLGDADERAEDRDPESSIQLATFEVRLVAPGTGESGDDFFDGDIEDDDSDSEYEESDPITAILRDKREIFGCPLPEGVEEHLKSLPTNEAMQWLFAWEGAGLIGALKRFGIPHQADAIASIILGESVTKPELESDLGNLPRLLVALGFGDYFQDWIEQAIRGENGGPEDDDEALDDAGTELIDEVLEVAEGQRARLIVDGAIEVPLVNAHAVAYLALFCDPEASLVFHVTPTSAIGAKALPTDGLFQTADDGEGGLYIAPEDSEMLFMPEGRPLRNALARLRDGTGLALITAGSERRSGIQTYRGAVHNGKWMIEVAAPCHEGSVLRGALELAIAAAEKSGMNAVDESELNAVIDAARRDPVFEGRRPRNDGLTFRGDRADLAALAKLLFRQRFRDHWNVAEGERADAEDSEQWNNLRVQFADSLGHGTSGVTILEGHAARFIAVDSKSLKGSVAQAAADADAQMLAAGFEPLGALVAEILGATVMCGYVHLASQTYGLFYPNAHGQSYMDFYTRFSGGVSLTTSTTPGQYSRRERGIFHRTSSATSVKELFAEHQRGYAILRERGLTPEPAEPSREALARAIDEYLTRRH